MADAGLVASGAKADPSRTPRRAAAGSGLADVGDAGAAPLGASGGGEAIAGLHSSPSEAYTSDDGGGGGGGEDASGDDTAAGGGGGGGATPGRKASGGKGSGRGTKAGARGVGNGKPTARTAPPVLLLLAGLPGSGKSTFSRELLRTSPIAWVHVNQDAIRDGRPGSREHCLAAARAALGEGACCVVDRCHADAAQRDALRAVAAERGLAAHCVALQTPLELCVKRVAARTDHPGGVQGDGSKRVVYTMAGQMKKGNSWPPATTEGFASVMDCHNDADASAAVRAWTVYGSDVADARAVEAGSPSAPAAGEGGGGRKGSAGAAASAAPSPATHGSAGTQQDAPPAGAAAAAAADAEAATLAVWQDYIAKRKPASAGIKSFFKPAVAPAKETHGGAGAAGAAAAAKVGEPGSAAAKAGGTITTGTAAASAAGGPAATSSGKPTRSSLGGETAGKGAVAATAPGAKNPALEKPSPGGTRRPTAEPPAGEPSAKRQATEAPKGAGGGGGGASAGGGGSRASDSPAGSGKSGSAAAGGGKPSQGCQEGAGTSHGIGRNAFAVLMTSASRKAADGRSGAGKSDAGSKHPGGGHTGGEPDARFKLGAPWVQALRNTALHPEQAQQEVLYKDDQVIMIRDVYPKAKHHALVIARDAALRSIADLRQEHLPLMEHMQEVACKWLHEERSKDPSAAAFKLGFHAVPSMCQVHMHVISQDFDSPALKNKKHWNSFTTQFFLPLDAVQRELATHGRLTLISGEEEAELEGQELRCHGCNKAMKNMPELKKHILACEAVKRLPGL